jgi:DNA-binding response OmpR family regulator
LIECKSEISKKEYYILVVDDEPAVRMTIEEMLKPLNCKIFHANNGNEALDIIRTGKVDLVILDVLLPGRHGFYVCSSIREMEQGRNIPILMMTAVYTKMKYYYQAQECGVNAYMVKPFKMDDLISKVSKLLNIGSRQQMATEKAF